MTARECPFKKVPYVEIVEGKCEIGEGCSCYYGYPAFKAPTVEKIFKEADENKFTLRIMRW